MITAARQYLVFLQRSARIAFVGDWRYYTWMAVLTVITLLGLNAYAKQLVHGLVVTGMSDEVSWGVYIANFTFLVGVAAAAVMMVIPVYIYDNEELHDLVIFGELLAVAAIIMCLLFFLPFCIMGRYIILSSTLAHDTYHYTTHNSSRAH